MSNGIIFNIQRYSINDGPGIRSTVFLKGCNLKCFWCHNVESQEMKAQLQFFTVKCKECLSCVEACNNGAQQIIDGKRILNRDLCKECFSCVDECLYNALVKVGKEVSVEEVMKEVLEDKPYYLSSNGGVTVSGGEPLLQIEFLKELLKKLKENKTHTAVDTAGCVKWENFTEIIKYTDLFLFDIKTMDSERHLKTTGVKNELILDNLVKLSKEKVDIIIRVPIVYGLNEKEENIKKIAEFVNKLDNIKKVELLPYNKMAGAKYENLGIEYKIEDETVISKEKLKEYSRFFSCNNS